jgi:YVTN family beta-propeller protein
MVFSFPAATQQKPAKPELLPTGQSITPTATPGANFQKLNPGQSGHPERFSSDAVSTALSPDGKTLLVLTSGYNQWYDASGKKDLALSTEYIFVFDVTTNVPRRRQAIPIPTAFGGIAWNSEGTRFYVGGGVDDSVRSYAKNADIWAESGSPIPLGHSAGLGLAIKPMAAGVGVTEDGRRLVVANYENDSVSILDLITRKVSVELDLRPGKSDPTKAGTPGGEFPYGVAVRGNNRAYISSVRDRELVVVDFEPKPHVAAHIPLHGNPNKMALNRAGTRLYVAEDNSDTLAVVDTATNQVLGELGVTAPAEILSKLGGFKGSNPNSIALAPDEKTAYVTLGGANAVAVVRLGAEGIPTSVAGLIPTGWYPHSVSINHAGTTLFISNGKSNTGPNPGNCRNTTGKDTNDSAHCHAANQYVLQLSQAGLLTVPVPAAAAFPALTQRVSQNNRWPEIAASADAANQLHDVTGKIHHVVYIVKENRSYDQVLGDLEKGNGDPHLAILPEPVTPNHHQIARQFVTLDNFLVSGSVSGDGWNWSTAARTTDALEKGLHVEYTDHGLSYDYEGANRNINVGILGTADRMRSNPVNPADPDLLPGNADLIAPDGPGEPGGAAGAGYLWDSALRAGLTLRNYGFFLDDTRYDLKADVPGHIDPIRDARAQNMIVAFPDKPALAGLTDLYFAGFDQRLPDYWRFKEWEREFDAYVAGGNLPALEFIRVAHDHFGSFSTAIDGVNTVETEMADNDYAIGLILQKIAASPYARDTVVFITEDDAQNGPDHIDSHRSLALLAGAYVRQGPVISRRYTTVNLLRTIEDLLGMRPLGLNDAAAVPMADVFTAEFSPWTFTAKVPAVLRTTQLPLPPAAAAGLGTNEDGRYSRSLHNAAWWQAHMQGQNFDVEDDLDTERFNRALWLGLVGPGVPFPKHTTGVDLSNNRKELLEKFRAAQKN